MPSKQRFGLVPRIAALLFPLLLASALFGVTASPAQACRCAPQAPAEQSTRAKVVFAGTVSRLEYFFDSPDGDPGSAPIRWQWATFAVAEVWRGLESSSAQVRMGGTEGATCGFDLLKGADYLVMASPMDDGSLFTSVCHGTTELSEKARETYGLARGSPPTVTSRTVGVPAPVPESLAMARAVGVSEVYVRSGVARISPRTVARALLSGPALIVLVGVLVLGVLGMVMLSRGQQST